MKQFEQVGRAILSQIFSIFKAIFTEANFERTYQKCILWGQLCVFTTTGSTVQVLPGKGREAHAHSSCVPHSESWLIFPLSRKPQPGITEPVNRPLDAVYRAGASQRTANNMRLKNLCSSSVRSVLPSYLINLQTRYPYLEEKLKSKMGTIPKAGKDAEKLNVLHRWWDCKMVWLLWKTVWQFL